MKNTLGDLNERLFNQLKRLTNEDMEPEELDNEIKRAKAVTDVAKTITEAGKLALAACKFRDDRMDIDQNTPKMLEG